MADKIFSDYITFNTASANFVKANSDLPADIAAAYFYNAHYFYMEALSKQGILRMPFFVFTPEQIKIISDIAKVKLASVVLIDPFIEALFLYQNSKHEIEQYFNLWFAPRGGAFQTQAGLDAFLLTGQVMKMEADTVEKLAGLLDGLTVSEYGRFHAIFASAIRTLNPDGFVDGVNRARDFLNNIIVNLDNFKSSSDEPSRKLANTHLILNALALPKENLVFQQEYLKNMDLSLVTRMRAAGLQEVVPVNPRLNYPLAIHVWRNNVRIKLGDITGELQTYPLLPEKEKDWADKLAIGVVAFVALAVIAPAVIAGASTAMTTAAAQLSTFGAWVTAKAGELGVLATGAAVKEEQAELLNDGLESIKDNILDGGAPDLPPLTPPPVLPPLTPPPPAKAETNLAIPLGIGLAVLLMG